MRGRGLRARARPPVSRARHRSCAAGRRRSEPVGSWSLRSCRSPGYPRRSGPRPRPTTRARDAGRAGRLSAWQRAACAPAAPSSPVRRSARAPSLCVLPFQLEPVPRPGKIRTQFAVLRLRCAGEQHPFDPDVIVEPLEVRERLHRAADVCVQRRRGVCRELDAVRSGKRSRAEEAADPAAAGHVGLEHVDDVHEAQEVGEHVRVLARRDRLRRAVAEQAQPVDVVGRDRLLEVRHPLLAEGVCEPKRLLPLVRAVRVDEQLDITDRGAGGAHSCQVAIWRSADLHLHACESLGGPAAQLFLQPCVGVGREAAAGVQRHGLAHAAQQRAQGYAEQPRLEVPQGAGDRRDRAGCNPGPADVARRAGGRLPGTGHVERITPLDDLAQLRLHEPTRRGFAVGVAEPALTAGDRLDDHDRRRVPLQRPVRFRLLGRDRVRHDGDALDRSVESRRDGHFRPGSTSLTSCWTDWRIIAPRFGSLRAACVKCFACSSEMWGGSGGTSGSVTASSTNGRSAANASSHAPAISLGSSIRRPASPSSSAYCAYGKSGIAWVAGYFGSPSSARCSHVTWFRSRLFSTSTTSRGSLQRCQYFAIVISSFRPFICIAPSPTSAIATRYGCANFAAIAYGTPGPIVARVPESDASIPLRTLTSRANQFAAEPESEVRMQLSGSREESSQNTRWGLIGSASVIARASISSHQSRTCFSIRSRQERSDFGSRCGSSARSVSFASPTRFTSIGYRSPISRASRSICTPFAFPSSGRNSEYGKLEPMTSSVS